MPLETLFLFFTAGLMAYATIQHATSALEPPIDKVQFVFAAMTALMIPFSILQVLMMQAQSESGYIWALKANLSTALLFATLLPWFIALYTELKSRWHWGLSLALLTLAIVNLWQPYSLQYSEFSGITSTQLPWGENYTKGIGKNGILAYLTATITILVYIHGLLAFWHHYRRLRRWLDLGLFLALILFLAATIMGILVRLSILDWVLPGPLGFIAMVLIMSIALSISTRHRLKTSEKRFRTLVEQSSFGIQIVSVNGELELTNPAWQSMIGLGANDFEQGPITLDHYVQQQGLLPYIKQGFAGESVDTPPLQWTLPSTIDTLQDQQTRWIHTKINPIRDEKGSVSHIILIHEDVTEEQQIENAIHRIAAGVASPSDTQFFQQMASNLTELFHIDAAFIGAIDEQDSEKVTTLALFSQEASPANDHYRLSEELICPNGEQKSSYLLSNHLANFPLLTLLNDTGTPHYLGAILCDSSGQAIGLLALLNRSSVQLTGVNPDILAIFVARASAELQQMRADQRILRMAYDDYLTGLSNRAFFHERLSQTLSEAQSSGNLGALLLIDLDHFKTINDALGHDVGDAVLRAVATRIKDVTGEKVLLARFGGDEFVVLMPQNTTLIEVAEQQARDTAQHILDTLKAPLSVGGRAFSVGASIGIVVFPQQDETELDILRHADMALYKAKNHGRGNIQSFIPALQVAAATRLKLEEGLRGAIANNELSLNYQPQVDVNGRCIGAEALLRWHHPELGAVSPDEFIPIAEETGLIHPIGRWVFEQACKDLSHWLEEDLPFLGHLSVNVSPWQFIASGFIDEIRNSVEKHKVDPRYLMLELTESTLLQDRQETITKLELLRNLGFQIALDDFGTGYSSLAYLKDLPLDQLKIDKSFIDELGITGSKQPLVESMYAIGLHMRLAVIAEGVETERQRALLVEMGGKNFQGYLFSKPLTESDFTAWLTATQRPR